MEKVVSLINEMLPFDIYKVLYLLTLFINKRIYNKIFN
ncbi:Uncharacterised protein [Bacteroides xylanisolvens]|nr:Uncharacterised protein [Bacteroides xylanisolvens]